MDKYRILTLNAIAAHGLHRLPASHYTVGKAIDLPDAILVRSHDMHATPIATMTEATIATVTTFTAIACSRSIPIRAN